MAGPFAQEDGARWGRSHALVERKPAPINHRPLRPRPHLELPPLTILLTRRMRLESVVGAHLEGIFAMGREAEVMRHISGAPATWERTAAWVDRVQRCWAAWGFGWWTFVDSASDRVIGKGCIQFARKQAEFPADPDALRGNPLEMGWRLHPEFWRCGLATEAAESMATFAFDDLKADELLAIRHPDHRAAQRTMERLGMRCRGLVNWYGKRAATHVLTSVRWQGLRSIVVAGT